MEHIGKAWRWELTLCVWEIGEISGEVYGRVASTGLEWIVYVEE